MNIALFLAAGKGVRFDQQKPKQLFRINGKTILEHALDVVEVLKAIDLTVVVIQPAYEKVLKEIMKNYQKRIEICEGGSTRQESVYQGLKCLKEWISEKEKNTVLIHDSARPFAGDVFSRVLEKLKTEEAVVPVIGSKDTVYVIKDNRVVDIPCRDSLFNVQTPQGFSFTVILDCHRRAVEKHMNAFTDDGSLYSKLTGKQPAVVNGDQMNFKITDKKDMLLAESFLLKAGNRSQSIQKVGENDG